jgi:ribosomal protein S18 acetylase RimI-like enzyme
VTADDRRRRLLDFLLRLDEEASEEIGSHPWGRGFLCPSLPLVWDANWVLIEQAGLSIERVGAIADEVLGGRGFAHRAVAIYDRGEERRLSGAVAELPGWELETVLCMEHRGAPPGEPRTAVREARLEEIEPLRRELIRESLPAGTGRVEETIDQLAELDRRYGLAAGDRWFVAPADGEPASACRLFAKDGIGQIEDVGTLAPQRNRGLARSVVLAALAASGADGKETTFLLAEADDWPRLLYGRLGFETTGEMAVLRRKPADGWAG